jgi:hypothetical protein
MSETARFVFRSLLTRMTIRSVLSTIFLFALLVCCNDRTQESVDSRSPILLADREAPLGWVYLRIYDDSTFEFESRGLERRGKIYSGEIGMSADTIFFHYKDSIPKAGSTAILRGDYVSYIDGAYRERVQIKLNELIIKED